MTTDNKTLADAQPGGRVRLGDGPAIEKLARELLAKEWEKLSFDAPVEELRAGCELPPVVAAGVRAIVAALSANPFPYGQRDDSDLLADLRDVEEHLYHAGSNPIHTATVRAAINALSAQPSPGGQDALDCIGRIEEAIEFRVPHDIYAAVHGELAELKAALAARQPVDENYEVWAQNAENVAAELTDERAIKALRFAARGIRCAASQPVRIYGCCAQPEGELHTAECPNMRHLAARQPVGQEPLWCLHVLGMDDVHPAPSKAHAEKAAAWHNEQFKDQAARLGISIEAKVVPWPHSAESHAAGVAEFIPQWLIPQWQLDALEANAAPPAQAVDLGQLPRVIELLSNVSRTLVDWAADEQREAIGIVKALIDSQAVGNG
ncbi:hypothetical protein JY407_05125 [Stenotrophomonas maltophilia]|nr:hypothetical protein [Stenotrophomonas maltophilia]